MKFLQFDGTGGAESARLLPDRLMEALASAPLENIDGVRPVISLPIPSEDGQKFVRFAVERSPITEEDTPSMTAYRGRGVDDPTTTTRFDITEAGLTGIVLTPGETYFIAPFKLEMKSMLPGDLGKDLHFDFASSRFTLPDGGHDCLVRRNDVPKPARKAAEERSEPLSADKFRQRTYRMAVAATSDYVKFHHDQHPELTEIEAAYQAIRTTINLLRGVYEREFGINFVLVNKARDLIFADPKKDPYAGKNVDAMLAQNKIELDRVLTSSGYDIGHLFATRGAGKAEIGSVCEDARKAMGLTGVSDASADTYFAIDYLAHEVGHQFGALHTFNGTKGFCKGGRVRESAFEPGSGWTIMGYAGICEDQDIAKRSQHYFHAASMQQITDAFSTTGACAKITTVTNHAPIFTPVPDYVVPAGTPVALLAKATDRDDSKSTYVWEEYYPPAFRPRWKPEDSPPDDDADGRLRPLLTSTSTQTLENFTYNEDRNRLQTLPRSGRTMNIRVTARDSRGRYGYEDITLKVAKKAGPFEIVSPGARNVWISGDSVDIRWHVAGTNKSPVNCSHIRVRLSLDDGQTYPYEIAAVAPNIGALSAKLPPGIPASETARVRLDAVGNVFFATSPRFRTGSVASAAVAGTGRSERGVASDEDILTACDIRSFGAAVEAFAVDANRYPTARQVSQESFAKKYGPGFPRSDAWGRPFRYLLNGAQTFVIASAGADGAFSANTARQYLSSSSLHASDDIVFSNGALIYSPDLPEDAACRCAPDVCDQ
ncbi:MAG TPA: zinc-dependent metalloprotease family protein [Thermoanaerobaculia bacterium]|nr:zinc-dependent metalloprotease family protein [Thermoanaerobaculia bacterium]